MHAITNICLQTCSLKWWIIMFVEHYRTLVSNCLSQSSSTRSAILNFGTLNIGTKPALTCYFE